MGEDITGYDCAGMSPMACGLVTMELHRGDGSLGVVLGVHAGLAMQSIAMCGSEEQKARWLPDMARMTKLGAFALTEPDHGSDSVALETSASPDGDGGWVLNGRKRWIGLVTVADLVVVWARNTNDGQVNGFVVEKGAAGYQAQVVEGKVPCALSGRPTSLWTTCECRRKPAGRGALVPGHQPSPGHYPGNLRLGGTRPCHGRVRHRPAVRPAAASVRPAAGQLPDHPAAAGVDARRSHRDAAVLPADRQACRSRRLTPTVAGLAKMHNTRKARAIAAEARDMLGGNGILLDYQVMRHMVDLEAIHTFEGTETMQTLIVGRAITGIAAFS